MFMSQITQIAVIIIGEEISDRLAPVFHELVATCFVTDGHTSNNGQPGKHVVTASLQEFFRHG